LTALLIQVKNSKKKNPYDVHKEHYELLFGLKNPIITIMVEFGIDKPAIYRVKSFASNVFAFTATGTGDDTYNCITSGGMKAALSNILNHPASGGNYRRDISDVNHRFRGHTWEERFPAWYIRAGDGTTPSYSPEDETAEAAPRGKVQKTEAQACEVPARESATETEAEL